MYKNNGGDIGLNTVSKRKNVICCVLSLIIICVLNLYNIQKLYGPVIFVDEVGYWATGAYIAGLEWSDVMQKAPYYGWGYGVLLSPIFHMFDSSIQMYRAAIFLNTIFLCCNFFVIRKIIIEIKGREQKNYIELIMPLILVLYSSFLFNSKTTYVESLLVLLFDLLVLVNIIYIKSKKFICMVLAAIIGVWMFSIHQRTIGILVALVLFFGLLVINKKMPKRHVVFFSSIVLGLLVISIIIKKDIVTNLFANGNTSGSNDFSGQVGKVGYLLSVEGIKAFIVNCFGRVVYLGNSTFLLFYVGVIVLCKDLLIIVKAFVKKKKIIITNNFEIKFFILLCAIAAIAISAIFMIKPTRFEHIIYGRYSEYIIIPILVYALLSWKKFNRKFIKYIIIFHYILTGIVYLNSIGNEYTSKGVFSTTGVRWIKGLGNMEDEVKYLLWTFVVVTAISMSLYFISKKNKLISLVFLACVWVYSSHQVCSSEIYSNQEVNKNIYNLLEDMDTTFANKEIYYVLQDEDKNTTPYWDMFRVRFLFYDYKINVVSYNNVANIKSGYLFVPEKYKEMFEESTLEKISNTEDQRMYLYKIEDIGMN